MNEAVDEIGAAVGLAWQPGEVRFTSKEKAKKGKKARHLKAEEKTEAKPEDGRK